MKTEQQDRHRGCLVGLAVGDAVGTTNEFHPPGSFKPITDMVGGGPFWLNPGEWTDDTSMALCLAQSLILHGFNLSDQLYRYAEWAERGYMSHNGRCFDIGGTVSQGIHAFQSGISPARCGSEGPRSISNGSMMRLAPVPMRYFRSLNKTIEFSVISSKTTHRHPVVLDAVGLLATFLFRALNGETKEEILDFADCRTREMQIVASGSYKKNNPPDIRGTGYAPASLEAALWCFHTSSSFENGALLAANLGDDADTTGAIYGQIAGAHYGYSAIPQKWLNLLAWHRRIVEMADRLHELSEEEK